MRFSHFFIDRPIFAAVLSVVFVILGGVSYGRLPVAQCKEARHVRREFCGRRSCSEVPGWVEISPSGARR